MTHAAKKITHGEYQYRGHKIEEVGRYADGKPMWNITANTVESAHDTANTLKDAKAMIDYWVEMRVAA